MIFRQVLYPASGCASYVLGCLNEEQLAVSDPHEALLDEYGGIASSAEARISAIVETHVHADHRSGAVALAKLTGAPIYLHAAADVDYPHEAVHEGHSIELGNSLLRVLHTPGHTPDSMTLLGADRRR